MATALLARQSFDGAVRTEVPSCAEACAAGADMPRDLGAVAQHHLHHLDGPSAGRTLHARRNSRLPGETDMVQRLLEDGRVRRRRPKLPLT